MNQEIYLGGRRIAADAPVFIVAEMSANHLQDYDRAIEIIHAAKEAGADAIKLQTYTADTMTVDSDADCFINKGGLWDGIKEYDLYKQAYTPWEWHAGLMEEAKKCGLLCFSSPFDATAVDFLEELDAPAYKIASYEINDIPLIRRVAKLHKPVIFATGIAHLEDIERAMNVCREEGNEDVILLKCVSAYPTPYEDANLTAMIELYDQFGLPVGLSDHTPGWECDVAATVLGAQVIEKHFTLDKSWPGPDQKASLDPTEFKAMVQAVRHVEAALGDGHKHLTASEAPNKAIARKSIVATREIKAGEVFTEENLTTKRPGDGISPMLWYTVLGQTAKRDFAEDEKIEL